MITYRQATEDDFDFLWKLHPAELSPYVKEVWGWDEGWQTDYFRAHFDPTDQKIIMQ